MAEVHLFGLGFQNETVESVALNLINLAQANQQTKLFFVNAHCVTVASRHKKYFETLKRADILCADGAGMAIAAKLTSTPFNDNVNGTDLFPFLCKEARQSEIRLGFLGAKPGVAETTAQKMRIQHPGLEIAYCHDGYFLPEQELDIINDINTSGVQILLVAQGVPKQELFIDKWSPRLKPSILIGVGALFDFYSEKITRAPKWVRSVGMEWLFRLSLEPHRLWRRYLIGNMTFLSLCFNRRLIGASTLKNKPFHGE